MKWFVLIFFFLYLFIHSYTFFRLIRTNFSSRVSSILIFLFIFMLLSPLSWRFLDERAPQSITYLVVLTSLLWMGFIFYTAFFTLSLDVYRNIVTVSKKLFGVNPLPIPSPRLSFYTILLASFFLSVYSYWETLGLRVIRITIKTDKLPPHVRNIKILHISDVHLGPVMGTDKVLLIKKVWEKERPDIIVSTGDLIDGNMRRKDGLASMLKNMHAPLGKFAVLGNHEYYRGVEQAIDFTNRAGFYLLKGERVDLGPLVIVGVDDDDCRFFNACKGTVDEYQILKDTPKDKFVLLLKHKPRLNPSSAGLFDLMLSGHTHGGIYKPVGEFIIKRMFITDRGLVRVKDSYVFVSKGVGTGGPPMRLFSPPDVAIVEILNSAQKSIKLVQ